MPCFKAKTWILAISVATAIGLGATPAAFAKSAGETVAADPLQALNDAFRAEYKATRHDIIDRTKPVIVVKSGELIFYRRNEPPLTESFTPKLYHDLKTIAHVPLAIYTILVSGDEGEIGAERRHRLEDFRALLLKARPALEERGFAPDVLKRQRQIVTASLAFSGGVLKLGSFQWGDLIGFAETLKPVVMENVALAAKTQIDALHDLVLRWRLRVGEQVWGNLNVVVLGPRQARAGNLQYAYFSRMMGQAAEGKRLFYAENIFDEKGGLKLLGTILLDRGASAAFFNDLERLERDLMADAAAEYLDEMFGPAVKAEAQEAGK